MKKIRKKLRIKNRLIEYISTNRLFLAYMILSFITTLLVRHYTIGNVWQFAPIVTDLTIILFFGGLGYLIKPKKQFRYYFTATIIYAIVGIANAIYYKFYMSFISFSLLSTISQVGEVQGSIFEKLVLTDFIYILFPIIFYLIHKYLNKTTYYDMVSKVENGKKMCTKILLISVISASLIIINLDKVDFSRLVKQWNREYIVSKFGIITYQINDLFQSVTPKISGLFGYDEAARQFREFYSKLKEERESQDLTNKYTGIFEDKNVIFVHMESIQNFFIDLKINNQELTPTLNKISKEGMYFSDFFPQISTGTSADTEFTINTSLMPTLSGIAFVSNTDKTFVSTQKLLKEQGYYTFSTHGNKSSMWNRNNMHPNLGYDNMFFQDSFEVTKENSIGLGISDQAFYNQLLPIMEKIDEENENYTGTIITLSNHSPFTKTKEGTPELYYTYGKLDLTNQITKLNEKTNEMETIEDNYLEETKLGNYIHSAHYADLAMGEFLENVKNSEHFKDTVFVFYGDHDAKLSSKEYQKFYNYNKKTGEQYTEQDEEYVPYDYFEHEINRKTPLIIWSPNDKLNSKIQGEIPYTMGMIDVQPTLGNMFGFENPFSLGHDIFEIKEDNVVLFPNGNLVTEKIYYNNSKSTHYIRKEGTVLEDNYITDLMAYSEERLEQSNKLVLYDLIIKEGDKIDFPYGDLNE